MPPGKYASYADTLQTKDVTDGILQSTSVFKGVFEIVLLTDLIADADQRQRFLRRNLRAGGQALTQAFVDSLCLELEAGFHIRHFNRPDFRVVKQMS